MKSSIVTLVPLAWALRIVVVCVVAVPAAVFSPSPGNSADNLFATAIRVNNGVITWFELDQYRRMLDMLGSPGDNYDTAREQLIDTQLYLQAAEEAGIQVLRGEIDNGLEEFAGRFNLNAEAFIAAMARGGVGESTLRKFIKAETAWRNLARGRFFNRARPSPGEISRAIASGSGGSRIRVQLAEIILDASAGQTASARDLAGRLSQIRSVPEFADAARRHSIAQTRSGGGLLPWRDLGEYPPNLQGIIIGLASGEVSDPIPLGGEQLAILQMRGIDEVPLSGIENATIEYTRVEIGAGSGTEARTNEFEGLSASAETCNDLTAFYGENEEVTVTRHSVSTLAVEPGVGERLALLDAGEISPATAGPEGISFLMLCSRTPASVQGLSHEEIGSGIFNRRLKAYAAGFLSELRANARVVDNTQPESVSTRQ